MALVTELYKDQVEVWPKEGRHILAQFDDDSIVEYQAYGPAIGRFAIENGVFGGGFSYSRMSWMKPNFLWMMYRSGWGTKENQEVTLACGSGGRFSTRCFPKLCPHRGTVASSAPKRSGHGQWDGRPCGCSGIRTTIHRGPSWNDGPSSWVCVAWHWRHSDGGN